MTKQQMNNYFNDCVGNCMQDLEDVGVKNVVKTLVKSHIYTLKEKLKQGVSDEQKQ